MKLKIILWLTAALLCHNVMAQDQATSGVREYGIGLSSFNSFSLQYLWGTQDKRFRFTGSIAVNTTTGNSSDNYISYDSTISNSTGKTTTPLDLTFGFGFSMLNVKMLSDRFGTVFGEIISFNYTTSEHTTDDNVQYTGGYVEAVKRTSTIK